MTQLNDAQLAAVTTDAPRVLLSAVPGSGKTQTLAERCASLMRERGYSPENILCLTFSRKAAIEMRHRIARLLPGFALQTLMVATFHAFAHWLLRGFGSPRYRPGLSVIDQMERQAMIEDLIRENAYDRLKGLAKRVESLFRREIAAAADDLTAAHGASALTPEEQAAMRLLQQYRHRLASINAIDIDDMVPEAGRLVREQADLASVLRGRFAHVQVDEFQDTSPDQQALLDALNPSSLFVVGDYRQAIYSFRGARPRGFLDFARREFVQVLRLDLNYRSRSEICKHANALAQHATERMEGEIIPDRAGGERVGRVAAVSHDEPTTEAAYVTAAIRRQHESGHRWGDIAVLARTNSALDLTERALLSADIPVLAAQRRARAWDSLEVRWLINLLRLFRNPDDSRALEALLRWPTALASASDLADWRLRAHECGTSLGLAILASDTGEGAEVPARQVLREIAAERANATDLSKASELLLALLCCFPEDVRGRLLDAVRLIVEWEAEQTGASVRDLLSWYAGRQIVDALPERTDVDAVRLLTVHGAKGLEWPVVFVLGLDDESMPAKWAGGEPEIIEEERRVLYVAITRARDLCILSYTRKSAPARGPAKVRQPSRFLSELGVESAPAMDRAAALPEEVVDALPF